MIENGLIKSTSLGYEDHGILTACLHIKGEGWGCGFGGYELDAWDPERKDRFGVAYGTEFISHIIKTVGVERWEDLPQKHIRIDSEGLGGRILRIGHITKNKWFDPKQLAEEML